MSPEPNSIEKPVVSFRLSTTLVAWLRKASKDRDWSMNEYVAKLIDGLRGWWGLPAMISDILEDDRKAMGLDHYDYLGHLLARRYMEIRENGGPGFEKKKPRK